MDAKLKQEVIEGTLAWCNTIRERRGMQPLEELPKGRRYSASSCPCGKATGLEVYAADAYDPKTGEHYSPSIYVEMFVVYFDNKLIPELIES